MLRLTGMDLKLEQYQQGERFVRASPRRRAGGARAPLGRPGGAAARRRDRRTRAPGSPRGRCRRRAGSRRAGDRGAGPRRAAGPGHGPGGVPAAIALTPDPVGALPRRTTSSGSRRRRPGARLVSVSLEGLADGPLDDVEVLLRGPLPADAFDRILARAPAA